MRHMGIGQVVRIGDGTPTGLAADTTTSAGYAIAER